MKYDARIICKCGETQNIKIIKPVKESERGYPQEAVSDNENIQVYESYMEEFVFKCHKCGNKLYVSN